ncbi:cyclophilin-like fold protein [Niabella drilacis]|nr:cyclophilin-like fold protein [Niabella drilacis]
MKLKITIGDKTATAILYDNPTSRDFAAMLPLTVKLDDYSNTEKIFYPSCKLSTKDAPAGFDPSIGDITLYAPWGNIALFYKDFGYSNGLISLGKITSGMDAFTVKGSATVKFELEK